MYTSSDTRLEWPEEGPLFESDSNKRREQNGATASLQPLGRYGTHQETVSRRPEQMYTPSDTRLEWLGEGPFFKSHLIKGWRAKTQPLFESFPAP